MQWMDEAKKVLEKIEETQVDNITKASDMMADSIGQERWVHLFGCGHSTLPCLELYPRIGSYVGFHHMLETPITYFPHVRGDMGVRQFCFLERTRHYGELIIGNYDIEPPDSIIVFSHSGINVVVLEVATVAKEKGLKVIAINSTESFAGEKSAHPSGKNISEIADVTIDAGVPARDACVPLPDYVDNVGPLSNIAFFSIANLLLVETAKKLVDRGKKLFIHPSHNVPGDDTSMQRLDAALDEYKRLSKVL